MGKLNTKRFKAFLFIVEERFAAPSFKQLQQYVKSIGCESIDECIEKKEDGSLEKFISDWYKAVEYSAEYRNHLKENNVFFYIFTIILCIPIPVSPPMTYAIYYTRSP